MNTNDNPQQAVDEVNAAVQHAIATLYSALAHTGATSLAAPLLDAKNEAVGFVYVVGGDLDKVKQAIKTCNELDEEWAKKAESVEFFKPTNPRAN